MCCVPFRSGWSKRAGIVASGGLIGWMRLADEDTDGVDEDEEENIEEHELLTLRLLDPGCGLGLKMFMLKIVTQRLRMCFTMVTLLL